MSEARSRARRLLDRFRRREASTPESSLDTLIGRLLSHHEPIAQRADAATVAEIYFALGEEERLRFLHRLGGEFHTDPGAIDSAIAAVQGAQDSTERREVEARLRVALTPAANRLFDLFAGVDGGVKLLVDMRADLLRHGDPEFARIGHELYLYLVRLFDAGRLELRRITWDAPASLLEKLIAYEAVHAIDSWNDLKNRLDSDRRCYAFFHPAMPDEPLVFVEIALTAGIATALPPLLDEDAPELDPAQTDTAVFYSISSCQPGLEDIKLGTALIKQVVDELGRELPHVRRFVTLSPMPGFRRWLETHGVAELSESEALQLPAEPKRFLERLADPDWIDDEAIAPALLALAARYLTSVTDGRVLDPVANFHLSNGAALERVNWFADPSPTGWERSAGMMANYEYEPERMAERAEAYATRAQVAMSDSVREALVWRS